MNRKNILIIFMKAPRPGTVKTRLQPELTPEQSQMLYRAMAEDLVNKFREASEFDLQIHFWPPDGREELIEWLGDDLAYHPQQGSNLGEKMHLSFVHVFEQGYRKAIIIGSDLPTLDFAQLEEAYRQLQTHDAVLGPTEDGGYYLIALKTPHPELFRNVPWSTPAVLSQTLKNARQANLRVARLNQERDLDTFPEVRRLWERLNQPQAGIEKTAIPRTAAALAELFAKSGHEK